MGTRNNPQFRARRSRDTNDMDNIEWSYTHE